MLSLWVLRHAAAEEQAPGRRDFERALSERGRRQAEAIRARYGGDSEQAVLPSLVLVSPARRARQTAEIAFGGIRGCELVVEEGIYQAGADELMALVADLEAHPEGTVPRQVALVGHNPAVALFARALLSEGEEASSPPGAAEALRRSYPPATLARFEVPTERWDAPLWGVGRLVELFSPGVRNCSANYH